MSIGRQISPPTTQDLRDTCSGENSCPFNPEWMRGDWAFLRKVGWIDFLGQIGGGKEKTEVS